ncbi:hypothetical protein CB697_20260 [Salmonella enterica subsp. enterica serovar Chester]|nr:hypothetical protein [Salmonella enterica subsp. enterica serovar Chester]
MCTFLSHFYSTYGILQEKNWEIYQSPMKTRVEYNFHDASQWAARAERAGEYEDAAKFWREAAVLAENARNIEWAMRRKLFCAKRTLRSYKLCIDSKQS